MQLEWGRTLLNQQTFPHDLQPAKHILEGSKTIRYRVMKIINNKIEFADSVNYLVINSVRKTNHSCMNLSRLWVRVLNGVTFLKIYLINSIFYFKWPTTAQSRLQIGPEKVGE